MARGDFRIVFSATQGAVDLWTYGEDGLAPRALEIPDEDMPALWLRAGGYFIGGKSALPLHSNLWADKARAFALIYYFEGDLRPLTRERRRARSRLPEIFANATPVAHTPEWLARLHAP